RDYSACCTLLAVLLEMSRNGRTMVPGELRPMASNIAPKAAGGSFRIARLTAKRGQIHDPPAIPSKQASSDSTMFMSNPFAELSGVGGGRRHGDIRCRDGLVGRRWDAFRHRA